MSVEEIRLLLRRLRDESGLGEREIARRAGISQRALSFFLNGRSSMGADNLERVCAVLGLDLTTRPLK